MGAILMLESNLNGNVIDVKHDSTQAGAYLDAYPAKAGFRLGPTQEPLAANQAWEILPDPAGSPHHIIRNPATGHRIDISEASLKPGAALDAYPANGHENQLWDFLPDQFGSGSCFIQNPQTGYVIEIAHASTAAGAALVVNPRRLFDNQHQLWSGVDKDFSAVALPALKMAKPPAEFGSNNQYVLLAPNQSTNLTSVEVSIDILEDLIADSFSIQINGTAPAKSGANLDAQWLQFLLVMEDNKLMLFNQVWHALGPDKPGDPLASQPENSAPMLTLENDTVPAGTQIVLTLRIDHSHDDFVTAVSGRLSHNGVPIGTPVTFSVVGQPTFNPGGPVKESDLAPFGALSVVVVGAPGGTTNLSSGMGTITVVCDPAVTVSSEPIGPNPHGIQTGEESNCHYGEVQEGSFKQIVQPFGVVSPKITEVTGDAVVSGSGLYPNTHLKATAIYWGDEFPVPIDGLVNDLAPSGPDGSFGIGVEAENPIANHVADTLTVAVTDGEGNSVWANIANGVGWPKVIASHGTPRKAW